MTEFISKLNNLKLIELRELATKYNLSQKIQNIHKLKKQELIVQLLMRADEIMKIYNEDLSRAKIRENVGLPPEKERKPRTLKPKEQTQLNKDIDELVKEQNKIADEVRSEKDIKKKIILISKIKEIGKKINRLSPYIERDVEAEKKKAEEAQKEIDEIKKEETDRLLGQTNEQKKYRLKMEIDQIERSIKNIEAKQNKAKTREEMDKLTDKKQELLNKLINKETELGQVDIKPDIIQQPEVVEEPKVEKTKFKFKLSSILKNCGKYHYITLKKTEGSYIPIGYKSYDKVRSIKITEDDTVLIMVKLNRTEKKVYKLEKKSPIKVLDAPFYATIYPFDRVNNKFIMGPEFPKKIGFPKKYLTKIMKKDDVCDIIKKDVLQICMAYLNDKIKIGLIALNNITDINKMKFPKNKSNNKSNI